MAEKSNFITELPENKLLLLMIRVRLLIDMKPNLFPLKKAMHTHEEKINHLNIEKKVFNTFEKMQQSTKWNVGCVHCV